MVRFPTSRVRRVSSTSALCICTRWRSLNHDRAPRLPIVLAADLIPTMSLALVTDAVPGNVTYGVSHDVTRHHWLHKVFRPMDLITSMPHWLRPRRNLRYALRLRLIVNTRSALPSPPALSLGRRPRVHTGWPLWSLPGSVGPHLSGLELLEGQHRCLLRTKSTAHEHRMFRCCCPTRMRRPARPIPPWCGIRADAGRVACATNWGAAETVGIGTNA